MMDVAVRNTYVGLALTWTLWAGLMTAATTLVDHPMRLIPVVVIGVGAGRLTALCLTKVRWGL